MPLRAFYRHAIRTLLVCHVAVAVGVVSQPAFSAPIHDRDQIETVMRTTAGARVLVQVKEGASDQRPLGPATSEDQVVRRLGAMRALLSRSIGQRAAMQADPATQPRFLPNVGFLAITVTAHQLGRLAGEPLVHAIYPNTAMPLGAPPATDAVRATAQVNWVTWHKLIRSNDAIISKAMGAGAVVIVLDTGVDLAMPYFKGVSAGEACFTTKSNLYDPTCPNRTIQQTTGHAAFPPCGFAPKECFHGTFVASIISGKSTDGKYPLRGIAPQAKIFAINVFSRLRAVSALHVLSEDLARAADYLLGQSRTNPALKNKKLIVNMSFRANLLTKFGKDSASCNSYNGAVVAQLGRLLQGADITLVAASGNQGSKDKMDWPACRLEVLDVGASTLEDKKWPNTNFAQFWAPGASIIGLKPRIAGHPNGVPAIASGTSFAAPQAAALAAILRGCCAGPKEPLTLGFRVFPVQTSWEGARLSVTSGVTQGLKNKLFFSDYGKGVAAKASCTSVKSGNGRLLSGNCLAGLQLFGIGTGGTNVKYKIVTSSGEPIFVAKTGTLSSNRFIALGFNSQKMLGLRQSKVFKGKLTLSNLSTPAQTKDNPILVDYQVQFTYQP